MSGDEQRLHQRLQQQQAYQHSTPAHYGAGQYAHTIPAWPGRQPWQHETVRPQQQGAARAATLPVPSTFQSAPWQGHLGAQQPHRPPTNYQSETHMLRQRLMEQAVLRATNDVPRAPQFHAQPGPGLQPIPERSCALNSGLVANLDFAGPSPPAPLADPNDSHDYGFLARSPNSMNLDPYARQLRDHRATPQENRVLYKLLSGGMMGQGPVAAAGETARSRRALRAHRLVSWRSNQSAMESDRQEGVVDVGAVALRFPERYVPRAPVTPTATVAPSHLAGAPSAALHNALLSTEDRVSQSDPQLAGRLSANVGATATTAVAAGAPRDHVDEAFSYEQLPQTALTATSAEEQAVHDVSPAHSHENRRNLGGMNSFNRRSIVSGRSGALAPPREPRLARTKPTWFSRDVLRGMPQASQDQVLESLAPARGRALHRGFVGGPSIPGVRHGSVSEARASASGMSSESSVAPLAHFCLEYLHNDQTYDEPYWQDPPSPAVECLNTGPFSYPRVFASHMHARGVTDLEEFLEDPGGGEGVMKLLKARDFAEESFGYEWLHTVLVMKGRSFPALPGLVLAVWTAVCTLLFMLWLQFDQFLIEQLTSKIDDSIPNYKRLVFMYMQGLNIPVGMIGAAITFLLVFRVNTGYERWWEGRRTFRDIVNHSRDLGRQVTTSITDWHLAEKMIRWIIVSVYMLKRHVREESYVDELRGIVSDQALNFLETSRNKPFAAAQRLSSLMYSAIAAESLFPDLVPALDLNISDLVNSIGTCEMILTTPMPFAYVAHLRTFILIWLALLPPIFCSFLGWAAPIVMALVTTLFLGLDSISGEIENPFGYDWNDLPLDSILAQLVSDLIQSLQVMLDIPVHKSIVTFSDLARFNVSAFGADAIIQHLNNGGDAVAPVFPSESIFMRQFRKVVLMQEGSDDEEDDDEAESSASQSGATSHQSASAPSDAKVTFKLDT